MKKYLAYAGAILSALLLGIAGVKAQSKRAAANRKENKAIVLMNTGIDANIKKAEALNQSAQKDKEKAIAAKQKAEKRLQELGESNETLDSIAHDFNSRRVRRRPRNSS